MKNAIVDVEYKGKRLIFDDLTKEQAEALIDVFGIYNCRGERRTAELRTAVLRGAMLAKTSEKTSEQFEEWFGKEYPSVD